LSSTRQYSRKTRQVNAAATHKYKSKNVKTRAQSAPHPPTRVKVAWARAPRTITFPSRCRPYVRSEGTPPAKSDSHLSKVCGTAPVDLRFHDQEYNSPGCYVLTGLSRLQDMGCCKHRRPRAILTPTPAWQSNPATVDGGTRKPHRVASETQDHGRIPESQHSPRGCASGRRGLGARQRAGYR